MLESKRFVIVGAGAVGCSLAAALAERGLTVAAVASRTEASARRGAELGGAPLATTDVARAAREGDVVVLSVPDDAIAEVCRAVTAGGGFAKGDVAIHLSGALGSKVLEPARRAGARALSFHPAQTFARPDARLFEEIVVALEGDAEALSVGEELARRLGATPVALGTEQKVLYHAALCVGCNYVVALADAAVRLLEKAGLEEEALRTYAPLLRATAANIQSVGPARALTGPISRGDVATVKRHLEALDRQAPEMGELYRVAGLWCVETALAKGTITAAQAEALRALLRA